MASQLGKEGGPLCVLLSHRAQEEGSIHEDDGEYCVPGASPCCCFAQLDMTEQNLEGGSRRGTWELPAKSRGPGCAGCGHEITGTGQGCRWYWGLVRKSAGPHLGPSGSSGRDASVHSGRRCPSLICGLACFRWLLGTPPIGRSPPANMSLFLQWLCIQTLHTGRMFWTPPSVLAHLRILPSGCLQATLLGHCLPLGLLWAADLSRLGFATYSVLLGFLLL